MDSGSEDWPSSRSLDMQHPLEGSLKLSCSEWVQHFLQSRDPSSAGTGLRNQKFPKDHIPRREKKSSVVFQEIGNEQEMYSFFLYCLFLPSNANFPVASHCFAILCHNICLLRGFGLLEKFRNWMQLCTCTCVLLKGQLIQQPSAMPPSGNLA